MGNQQLKKAEISEEPKKWDFVRLHKLTIDLIGGGTPSTSQPEYWDGDIAWMTSANLTNRVIYRGMRNITKKGLKNSATNIVPKGSLLISTRVGIGKVGIAGIDVAISQDLTGLVPDKDKADVEYLYWAILNKSSQLSGLSQGSTVKGLTRDYVRNLEILLPSLPEQKKIAEILSTVDQAIEKVDEAIEKTQNLKKGLMNELLTKGIRHKEFQETEIGRMPKDWEVVKLENVIRDIKNGFASGKRDDNGIVQIRMNNVTTDGRLIFNAYLKVPRPESLDEWLLRKGDLLFNNTNSYDLVGKSTIFNSAPFPCTFSNHFTRIKFANEVIPEWVLFHFIRFWEKGFFRSVAIRHVGQSAVQTRYLINIKLPIPPLPEQQKIAEILSAVDKRLELLRERKERLGKIKKGLMDDLLTGKKRVRV